jgi:TonB-dependent receptor
VVFSPSSLLGDNVRNRFLLAGIPAEDSLPEILAQRRFAREETLAGYLQGEFSLFNERISGNVGVRVIKADLTARAMVVNVPGPGVTPNPSSNSYSDVLPSLNVVGHLTDKLQVRVGYGKGLTRPLLADLNPSLVVNTTNGNGSRGNPELNPLTADSFDLSAEWYFSPVGYLAVGVFDKEIDGFFTGISECETVAGVPAYAGATPNNCTGGQYFITRTVNSEPGYARGVEVAGQTFFDFLPGVFSHFGVQGSYAHVKTENPVRFTTNGPIFNVPQAFQSDDNYSVAALYDDGKVSSRLVYTYRSDYVLFGVSANPIDGRYLQGYGIVDFSLNYKLSDNFDVSLNASNLTNEAPDRFVGEPGSYATDLERQHYMNGRIYGVGLRYRFDR